MLRVLISGIWATANTLLNRDQNSSNEQSSTSTWHKFRNFIFSTISSVGIPFVRSITENETLYEYVNTCLAHSTTNRNNVDRRQQRNSGVSQSSRPNFRRRLYHNNGVIRIIKPTINIHIHQT
ncbi:unnamed protein product [Rotaria sp. Silwood1]|nr:unnamed protein product [Rotaria sp. Silwood1]CAF3322712.1 unnamed protein product [Rotaria sp. Silwood1]CAF3346879.1 unnamed protein product [Rotaria sp. Silwood1]CAF4544727.1 unnamed protein product [Rotaria sp. Silwood1]CAF4589127.1 unnamed protein product [Rotaria sp. Silwood1]